MLGMLDTATVRVTRPSLLLPHLLLPHLLLHHLLPLLLATCYFVLSTSCLLLTTYCVLLASNCPHCAPLPCALFFVHDTYIQECVYGEVGWQVERKHVSVEERGHPVRFE